MTKRHDSKGTATDGGTTTMRRPQPPALHMVSFKGPSRMWMRGQDNKKGGEGCGGK